jgi:hypothetical protein
LGLLHSFLAKLFSVVDDLVLQVGARFWPPIPPKPSAIPAGLKFMFELIGMISLLPVRHALALTLAISQGVDNQKPRQRRHRPPVLRRLTLKPGPRHRI